MHIHIADDTDVITMTSTDVHESILLGALAHGGPGFSIKYLGYFGVGPHESTEKHMRLQFKVNDQEQPIVATDEQSERAVRKIQGQLAMNPATSQLIVLDHEQTKHGELVRLKVDD